MELILARFFVSLVKLMNTAIFYHCYQSSDSPFRLILVWWFDQKGTVRWDLLKLWMETRTHIKFCKGSSLVVFRKSAILCTWVKNHDESRIIFQIFCRLSSVLETKKSELDFLFTKCMHSHAEFEVIETAELISNAEIRWNKL